MTQNGDKCRFGKGDFSKEFSYAALTCLGPDAPFVVLYDTVVSKRKSVLESILLACIYVFFVVDLLYLFITFYLFI